MAKKTKSGTDASTTEPKPRRQRTKKAKLELVRESEPVAAQESASARLALEPRIEPPTDAEQPKRSRARNTKPAAMTLAELSAKFLASLEADGKSDATVSAYRSDLAIAQRVLGAETAIDALRPADVQRFNESDAVVLAKSGVPKASPTVERTRRVLRLALDYAECEGWITVSPCGCESAEIEP